MLKLLFCFAVVLNADLVLKIKSAIDDKFLDLKGSFVRFKDLKRNFLAEFEFGEGKNGGIKIMDDQERFLTVDGDSLKWTSEENSQNRWTFMPLDASGGIITNQDGTCLVREGDKVALDECPDDLAAIGTKKFHFTMLLDATDEVIKQADSILKIHEKHVKELENQETGENNKKESSKIERKEKQKEAPVGIISSTEKPLVKNNHEERFLKEPERRHLQKAAENSHRDSSDQIEFLGFESSKTPPHQHHFSEERIENIPELYREKKTPYEIYREEGDKNRPYFHQRPSSAHYEDLILPGERNPSRPTPNLLHEGFPGQSWTSFDEKNLNFPAKSWECDKVAKPVIDSGNNLHRDPSSLGHNETINKINDTLESLKTRIESLIR